MWWSLSASSASVKLCMYSGLFWSRSEIKSRANQKNKKRTNSDEIQAIWKNRRRIARGRIPGTGVHREGGGVPGGRRRRRRRSSSPIALLQPLELTLLRRSRVLHLQVTGRARLLFGCTGSKWVSGPVRPIPFFFISDGPDEWFPSSGSGPTGPRFWPDSIAESVGFPLPCRRRLDSFSTLHYVS